MLLSRRVICITPVKSKEHEWMCSKLTLQIPAEIGPHHPFHFPCPQSRSTGRHQSYPDVHTKSGEIFWSHHTFLAEMSCHPFLGTLSTQPMPTRVAFHYSHLPHRNDLPCPEYGLLLYLGQISAIEVDPWPNPVQSVPSQQLACRYPKTKILLHSQHRMEEHPEAFHLEQFANFQSKSSLTSQQPNSSGHWAELHGGSPPNARWSAWSLRLTHTHQAVKRECPPHAWSKQMQLRLCHQQHWYPQKWLQNGPNP